METTARKTNWQKTLKKLFFRYFLISGLAAHLIVITAAVHFRSTGLTPHRYLQKVIGVLDNDSSPTRHIARAARLVFLDSGLVKDPVNEYPPDLKFRLPQWRGMGANALRTDTAPRYTSHGEPVATTDRDYWALSTPPTMRSVSVDSVQGLKDALSRAQPGQAIVLKPGHYVIKERLQLGIDGTPQSPLVLRGERIADTVLEIQGDGGLTAKGKYWTVSDLIVRGRCDRGSCANLVEIGEGASGFIVRNIFASGLNALLQTAREGHAPTTGLIDGITLVGAHVARPALSWPQHAVREIAIPKGAGRFLVMCPQQEGASDCETDSLPQAIKKLSDGGLLLMRSGVYRQAATVNRRNLHILAEPGATLYRRSTQGKGALVVDASVKIEGLACSHITVNDGNGCCVRQQHGDVTLIGVHFHHAQMGMLTGHNGGNIRVYDSYFHDSGYDESGQLGHNIYVNSGSFEFVRSWSIAARNAGHEIKSRAAQTIIADSLIASLNARDSRLIDAPNAGILDVRGSVLGEGPRSENWEAIGFGLEVRGDKPRHTTNSVTVRGNTFYIDRPQGAKLINAEHATSIDFTDNVVIGDVAAPDGNVQFDDREDAGARAYPALDPKTF